MDDITNFTSKLVHIYPKYDNVIQFLWKFGGLSRDFSILINSNVNIFLRRLKLYLNAKNQIIKATGDPRKRPWRVLLGAPDVVKTTQVGWTT